VLEDKPVSFILVRLTTELSTMLMLVLPKIVVLPLRF
jgi:hypothetical protein